MLKLKFKDQRQSPIWVMEKNFSIGREDGCNLTINDPSVSNLHAKVIYKGSKYYLKDLGSEFGTSVNGQRITQKQIACGDILKFGSIEMEIADPLFELTGQKKAYWSLIADSSWLSGQEFPLNITSGGRITIGRDNNSDLVFPGTHLSRTHAEIVIQKGKLILRDLGSSNGTYVNDRRIKEREIHPGDRIRLDVYSFKVFGPGIELPRSATSMIPAITDTSPNRAITDKQWKARPTSPGNREELNLYKKNRIPLILASIVLAAVVGSASYVGLNILGLLS